MKNENPIATDARLAERLRKLGPGPHVCIFCGVSDPLVLIPKTLGWLTERVPLPLLEKHHVLGKNHDKKFTVLLCRNCHAIVTEGYLQAGVQLRRITNPKKLLGYILKARAAFHRLLAENDCRWGSDLLEEACDDANDS